MIEAWFSPASITFTRLQVIFLLRHFAFLIEGTWPPSHILTGYSGSKKRTFSHTAYFEKAKQVAADLTSRLYQVGPDSLLLLIAYSTELEHQYYIRNLLSKSLRMDATEIDQRIDWALSYCCGWRQKQISYGRYCIQRRSYEKERARRLASLARE